MKASNDYGIFADKAVDEPDGWGRSRSAQRMLIDRLSGIDAQIEWFSATMASVDVPSEEESWQVAQILWEHERAGDWTYETGRLRPNGE